MTGSRRGRRRPASSPRGVPQAQSLRHKILVVDDDEDALLVLRDTLQGEGFSVLAAPDARQALLAAVDSRPDLILSDVAMPETDGAAFCRILKADPRAAGIPVILISGSRQSESDQLEGLESGADDYIPRPYPRRLLLAKVRAVLRRYAAPLELRETLKDAALSLDVCARTVRRAGREIPLTRKEFDLLTLLLRKPGRVLSIPYLLESVWGYDPAEYNDPNTVHTHVSTLRRKIGSEVGRRIVNVPALGYRYD